LGLRRMLSFASTIRRMVQDNSLEAIELDVFVELMMRQRMHDGIPKAGAELDHALGFNRRAKEAGTSRKTERTIG
jgi:hypothetical protein